MATISIILKKSKTNANGEHPVILRLADANNKRAYFATGFSSTDKQFDTSCGRFFQGRGIPTFTVKRKEDGGGIKEYTNREANDKLTELENRARGIIQGYNDNHINWGFEQFRGDYVNAPKRESFLAFAEGIVEQDYRDKGKKSTADTVKYTIKALKRFDTSLSSRTFPEITPKYLERFEAFSTNEGAIPGTISVRMRVIKRIYNIAIREKLVPRDQYPFSNGTDDGKYRVPTTKLTKTHQFLTADSLKKLANTKFERITLERDRHLFLFSFFCNGINWKDMALLTQKNLSLETFEDGTEGYVIRYQRAKTKGGFEIFVDDSIQRELDWFKANSVLFKDYLLPIVTQEISGDALHDYLAQKRKRFNSNLKEIAKELKLPKSQLDVTSYHARHSLAMYLFNEKQPIEVISETLGHQSVKTTKHYLAGFGSKRLWELTHIDLSLPEEDGKTIKAEKKPRKPRKPKEPKFKDAPVQEQEP